MKILFLSHQAHFIYGGEVCTLEIMRTLKEAGQEVYFASPKGPYQDRASDIVTCLTISSKEFNRSLVGLGKFIAGFYSSNRELQDIITKYEIDLVHATSLKSFVYTLGIARAKLAPVFWHHHDIMPDTFMNRLWLKFLAKFSTEILVPSQATKNALLLAKIPGSKISVIRNAFPLQQWKKRSCRENSANRPFQIFMVGEISHRKGSDYIFPLIEMLESAAPSRFCLAIVGGGLSDKAWSEAIISSNKAHCESGALRFMGRRNDVPTLLQEADALWVPSRQDPLPTVIVEAQLSGVPVLGSPNGGIPEMIQDGITGFICADLQQFVEKLLLLASDSVLWQKISRAARQEAEKNYSSERMREELFQVYQKWVKR